MTDRNAIDDAWIKSGMAARLLGCQPKALGHLVAKGLIGIRQLPGSRRRFLRSDVERLAQAATRPAVADALDRVATGVACEC